MAADQGLKKDICVLGAGVIGLSTAVQLQRRFKSHSVTIIADLFNRDTLSDGAGGIFRLSASLSGPSPTSIKKWALGSRKYYTELMRSDEAGIAGVQEVSGYLLSRNTAGPHQKKEMEFLKTFHHNVRSVSETELKEFNGKYGSGIFFTTIVIDGTRYLPYLLDKFVKNGGRVIKRTVNSLSELAGEHDIVVNCAGLRGAELTGDAKVVPIRGQLIRVKAPWIKHFYYSDLDGYIIPSTDTVAIGGTRQYHCYNTDVDRRDSEGIWERCCNLVPSLKSATIVKEWVGLRPHRDPIRVEAEHLNVDGKQLYVVHHYGHGGYGVTLAWGSATEATDLVERMIISKHQSRSKL